VRVWHIITGEYPPQAGGVSDYTRLVASGLASAGNKVHIWAPKCGFPLNSESRVEVHRLPGHFGTRALMAMARAIRSTAPCSVLVQYVPHAYGLKAMNLQFCLWLNSMRRADLTVMFHEVAFPVSLAQPFRYNVLGAVNRLMARLVSRSAARIMVASERWRTMLRKLGATAPISWVPVPSNIPVIADAVSSARWREDCSVGSGLLIGHFANYCDYSIMRLSEVAPRLLEEDGRLSFLLLGANSGELRGHLLHMDSHLARRVHATGPLTAPDISGALAACDLMVQPYPDGVSTRRSSTSALLAHGCAIVTTHGVATEHLWNDSGAVVTAPVDSRDRLRQAISQMTGSDEMRYRHRRAAQTLYDGRFALRHTIASLVAN
jgi:Glycosyl transferase 4-like domain/Glycosyl transferases group 1